MTRKMSESNPFNTTALKDADIKNAASNKQVLSMYLIVSSAKNKPKYHLCATKVSNNYGVDFKGFEVKECNVDMFSNWNEFEEYAKKEGLVKVEIFIPWQNISYIQNVVYKQK